MPYEEKLLERPLKRRFDDQARQEIDQVLARVRGELPGRPEFFWDAERPVLTIRSTLVSLIVSFTPELVSVSARMSIAARMLATDENKKQAVRLFESIAEGIGL
jgi:hypothetical protein